MTVTELAKQVGVDRRTLTGWLARGCPRTTPDEIREWRKANMESTGAVKAWSENVSLNEARTRKTIADAERTELENARLRGELYDAFEVEANVSELTGMIRTRLEMIPGELEIEFAPEWRDRMRERLADRIRAILVEMSSWRLSCDAEQEETNGEKETTEAAAV